ARHPIYAGILLTFWGYLLFSGDLAILIVGSGLFLLFYLKARYEERKLLQYYGQAYQEYMNKVGRFSPKQKR
ncbi:MAG: methyltransferase, partial [Bacteroidota bacterium]